MSVVLYDIAASAGFAALITLMVGLKAAPIARYLRTMDEPGERKLHKHPTPLLGGVALIIAVLPVIVWHIGAPGGFLRVKLALVVATGALSLIGILDDRHDLSARLRFLFTVAAFLCAFLIAPELTLDGLYMTSHGWILAFSEWAGGLFTLACLAGFLNAVNMADGKNGLVIGLCIAWMAIVVIVAPPPLVPIITALLAMLIVLMPFNLYGRLFLGDGGVYGISALVAILTIVVSQERPTLLTSDRVALLFAIPVFDTLRLVVVRLLAGRSPFAADRNHLHHYLLGAFGWPRGLLIYWLIAIGPSTLALIAPEYVPGLAVLAVVSYSLAILIGARVARQ